MPIRIQTSSSIHSIFHLNPEPSPKQISEDSANPSYSPKTLINPNQQARTSALEHGLDLAPPTLDLFPESSIFVKVPDGGFSEHRCERLWPEGKTPTFA
jgi:hypothetical protein